MRTPLLNRYGPDWTRLEITRLVGLQPGAVRLVVLIRQALYVWNCGEPILAGLSKARE